MMVGTVHRPLEQREIALCRVGGPLARYVLSGLVPHDMVSAFVLLPDAPVRGPQSQALELREKATHVMADARGDMVERLSDDQGGRQDSVSMHPLTPEQALSGFMKVDPAKVVKRAKKERKKERKKGSK